MEEIMIVDDPRVPQVPAGYKIYQLEDGRAMAVMPKDKRKSKGRVPKEPNRWFLMETDSGLFWIPENDYNTRPVREFMLAQGLQLEIKMPGFQMTSKAPKCSTILRQEYGMTGKPESLLKQFLEFRQMDMDKVPAHREFR